MKILDITIDINDSRWIWTKEEISSILKQSEELIKEDKLFGGICNICEGNSYEFNIFNTSHIVTKLYQLDDHILSGTIKILDTPQGNMMKDFLRFTENPKFGLRGNGVVNNNIVSNYILIGIDFIRGM